MSEPEENIRQLTLTGISWTGGTRVVQLVLQFGFAVALARLLPPRDFGLIAALMVFTGFGILFTDLGISPAIVQRRVIEARHLTSAFWLNVLMGTLLTLITMALAPALAAFYNEPQLLALTLVSAPVFLLSALAAVQNAVLDREMKFRKLSLIETAALIAGNTFAVAMALAGFGVWSLIGLSLALPAFRLCFLWFSVSWRPRGRPERQALRELWAYGKGFTGFTALTYWSRNADNLLIGRFIGVDPLAFYNRAYNLMALPNTTVGAVMTRVMIPALSRLQDDKERVKKIYVQSIGLITLLMFPFVIGMLTLAGPFILTIYGPRWAPAAPLLKILATVSLIQVVTGTASWIFLTQGRTDMLFRWGVFSSVTAIISFVVGLPWGVKGICVAYLCWNILIMYPLMAYAGRLINIGPAEVAEAVAAVVAAALVMAGAIEAAEAAIPADWGSALQLVTGIAVGGLAYLLACQLLKPTPYVEFRELMHEYRSFRGGAARPEVAATVATPEPAGEAEPNAATASGQEPSAEDAERTAAARRAELEGAEAGG